jgi:hypothetical protein
MGPHEAPEPTIEQVRALWPGWAVIRVFGGFLAVPLDTPVVQASFLSTLDDKLARYAEIEREEIESDSHEQT